MLFCLAVPEPTSTCNGKSISVCFTTTQLDRQPLLATHLSLIPNCSHATKETVNNGTSFCYTIAMDKCIASDTKVGSRPKKIILQERDNALKSFLNTR